MTTIKRHPATVLHEHVHSGGSCNLHFRGGDAASPFMCYGKTVIDARSKARIRVEADLARAKAEIAIQETRLLALDAAEELPVEMTIDELLALGPDDKWWEYRTYPDGTIHEPGWCMPDGDRHTAANLQADRANGWHDFRTEADCRTHYKITTAQRKLAEMERTP
ncbi:MAG: hypothetical protein EBQ92_00475 [Proteobacteria bacterium]|nr:hypothetical protein [Pseudomonadota bacterium]